MGDATGISWTDATWNPVRGCSRVSPGCQNCYAEVQAARIVRMGKGKPTAYDGLVRLVGKDKEPRWTGEVRLVAEQLAWPLRKRKPLRIFVNSMSDLFHEKLTNEQIAAVFGVMAAAPRHTFQCLTKRAKRMREWMEWAEGQAGCVSGRLAFILGEAAKALPSVPSAPCGDKHGPEGTTWPLPNVWIGVSCENQDAADERVPHLLATPAKVRFLSCEPLLGPLDLRGLGDRREGVPTMWAGGDWLRGYRREEDRDGIRAVLEERPRVDWVIVGCESGPGARPCDPAWVRSLAEQCAFPGVPLFVKQLVVDGKLRRKRDEFPEGLQRMEFPS